MDCINAKRGGGPKTPLYEGQGPENPGVVAAFCCCGLSRQPQTRSGQTVGEDRPTSLPSSCTVVTVLWRCLQFLDKFDTPVTPARCRVFFDKVVDVPAVLCNGVPQVQSVSLSVACKRHVTSMTYRIACLRAVHVTALPYFTTLPVSSLSQQTREQAGAFTEFSVLPVVFYHFRFSLGFGYFPNFWVQPSLPRLPARVGPFTSSVCKVLWVQFLAKF